MNDVRCLGLTALGLALAAPGAAQDLGHKAPAQARPVVITDATLHPVSGPTIAGGSLWFGEGSIQALGAAGGTTPPADAEHIDGRGLHVYPGLISAVTTLGLVEIGSSRATIDRTEIGDLTPEARAIVAVNPDSTALPVARSNGVLLAGVFPSGGLIAGRAAVAHMDGWTWEDLAVRADAGVVIEWPSRRPQRRFGPPRGGDSRPSVDERRAAIERHVLAARSYLQARAADPTVPLDVRHEALRGALLEDHPVFVRAADREAIESALAWTESEGLHAVLIGGTGAHACRDLLLRLEVPVIVTGTHRLPQRRDQAYDAPFSLPAALEAAGLQWCLASSGSFYNERNLPYHAATAVAYGLDRQAALRAITLSAAEVLGIADRYGSLERGKSATLIVTDGDPLELETRVLHAFIDGRRIDLANKQTALAEKYRERYRQLGLWGR